MVVIPRSIPIRIVIVEDDEGLRSSLSQLVNSDQDLSCIATFGDQETALREIPELRPDIAVVDLKLTEPGDGIRLIQALKQGLPELLFLVFTISEDAETIVKALEAGANGYLVKRLSHSKLVPAIKELRDGGSPLTPSVAKLILSKFHAQGQAKDELRKLSAQETKVLDLLSQGYLYKEIADKLNIEITSVREYVRRSIDKLQVNSPREAVAKFLGHQIQRHSTRSGGVPRRIR